MQKNISLSPSYLQRLQPSDLSHFNERKANLRLHVRIKEEPELIKLEQIKKLEEYHPILRLHCGL